MSNLEILSQIRARRADGEKIVFTNGCFDLLHVGHLRYLQAARALGDCLVIGLNADESVTRLKGPSRPILPEAERRELLLGLRVVDYVIVFAEDTPYKLISQVSPDVLVKGGDWSVENIVGADLVQARGGQVLSLPYVPGRSTSEIITQIVQSIGCQ